MKVNFLIRLQIEKDLLGHKDIRVTELYAKAAGGVLRRAMASFGNFQEDGYILVTRGEAGEAEEEKVPKTSARNRT